MLVTRVNLSWSDFLEVIFWYDKIPFGNWSETVELMVVGMEDEIHTDLYSGWRLLYKTRPGFGAIMWLSSWICDVVLSIKESLWVFSINLALWAIFSLIHLMIFTSAITLFVESGTDWTSKVALLWMFSPINPLEFVFWKNKIDNQPILHNYNSYIHFHWSNRNIQRFSHCNGRRFNLGVFSHHLWWHRNKFLVYIVEDQYWGTLFGDFFADKNDE